MPPSPAGTSSGRTVKRGTVQYLPTTSFAPNPVPIAVKMAPIAGRTDSYRRCSGSAGCCTIGEIDIAGEALRLRGWRGGLGCTAMAMPATVLAIVMAPVRSKATRMGQADRRHHGYLDDSETKDGMHQPFLMGTECHADWCCASSMTAVTSPVPVPARGIAIANHRTGQVA